MIRYKDGLLTPVYFIEKERSELLVPFIVDSNYGLVSLPLVKYGSLEPINIDKPKWKYRFRVRKGIHTIEVTGALNLFHGRIQSKTIWRSNFTKCDVTQVPLIVDWIKQVNKEPTYAGH